MLRYAGARVDDEDVFTSMFSDGQKQSDIVTAMMSLLSMMLPPHALHSGDVRPGGNPPGPGRSRFVEEVYKAAIGTEWVTRSERPWD